MRTYDRASIDLDGEWRFVPDPERLYTAGDLPAGQAIHVPGCWESQVERPYRIITAWYRRTFQVPADWAGHRALIRFGAVMYRCRVWLDGTPIGGHDGGFTGFVLDLGDALRPGTENELVVEAVNPLNAISEYPALAVDRVLLAEEWEPDLPLSQAPHGKQTWYSSQSGIWGSVRIERVAADHLDGLRVQPDLDASRAHVRWALDEPAGRQLTLELTLVDPGGRDVGRATVPVAIGERSGRVSIDVPDVQPWDLDHPHLYHVAARLDHAGETIDAGRARFGMRSITTRGGRILLNGKPLYMRGALDQDLYPDTIANPPSREFLRDQFQMAREMGLNLLRCHIKAPDPAYLDVADEVGILVWAELPNWTTFSSGAAQRGRQTLHEMVDAFYNSPALIAWTIINEDWGTDLRYEARDRRWLISMVRWLKELDPTRLVVDNSACETPTRPNFHLRTDLADFHAYFVSPDNALRWRDWVADFARRPAWLWSPYSDAEPQGDEPLVVSEFGSWGLPRLSALIDHYQREPWWFGTGMAYYRPAGLRRRFTEQGLDRIWPDVDALAEATQWHQFQNMQFEIGELRRHDSIQGYVLTEFTDANWEANGLLDVARGRKAFHEELADLNAADAVVALFDRRDLWGGAEVSIPLAVSVFGDGDGGGRVDWSVDLADGQTRSGTVRLAQWPVHGAADASAIVVQIPEVTSVTDADLELTMVDDGGRRRGGNRYRLAIVPRAGHQHHPMSVAVHDPLGVWDLEGRIGALGHRIASRDDAEVLVTSQLDEAILDHAHAGGRVLVLVRTREALPEGIDLTRRVAIHLRRLPHAGWPGQRSPWEGDWVTSYTWMLPELQAGLPPRSLLDFAYEQVLPDHVLLGYDPVRHRDEVAAGMFAGWVHTPAAVEWTFQQGQGWLTLTTFRVAPEDGPVATLLLDRLLERASGRGTDARLGASAQSGSGSPRRGANHAAPAARGARQRAR